MSLVRKWVDDGRLGKDRHARLGKVRAAVRLGGDDLNGALVRWLVGELVGGDAVKLGELSGYLDGWLEKVLVGREVPEGLSDEVRGRVEAEMGLQGDVMRELVAVFVKGVSSVSG